VTPKQTIWLTVYADLMTNLVLVFLALYGLTVLGADALTKAMESMKLEELTVTQDSGIKFEKLGPTLREKFRGVKDINVSDNASVVRIEFGEKVLFDSGAAILKETGKGALLPLAELLNAFDQTIVVEGHTDSVPLKSGGKYLDNRELSLARAMSVVRLFTEKAQVPPKKLAAAAYGSYRPRSSNLTLSGRRINRRVEIALFKEFKGG
jgi:chemotaxis protein MotB